MNQWYWSSTPGMCYGGLLCIALVQCVVTAQEHSPATVKSKLAAVDELGDPLPRHATLRLGTQRFQHPDSAIEMALSPDEKVIVSYGQGGLIAWDTQTGKSLWKESLGEYPPTSYGVRALAFSGSSEYFYCVFSANSITKFHTLTGQREVLEVSHELPLLPNNRPVGSLPGTLRSIDVTQDGAYLAAAGGHGVVVYNREGVRQFEVSNNPTEAIAPQQMNQDRLWFGGHYSLAQFNRQADLLAVVLSQAPRQLRIYSHPEGQLQQTIELTDNLVRFAFSPDGTAVACTERDSAVRQYSTADGQRQWSCELPKQNNAESYASAIAYASDGQQLAVAAALGARNSIFLLHPGTGQRQAELKGHAWKPWALAYTADSRMLYSTGWDGAIRRWDTSNFKQLDPPQGLRGTAVVAAVPNGHLIAHADDLGAVRILNINGQVQATFKLPDVRFSHLCFNADGTRLAAGGATEDQVTCVVWDVATSNTLHLWSWPKGQDPHSSVECLAFSPDGQRLAAAVFRQGKAYLWDLSNGQSVAIIAHPSIYGLSISRDNQTLATAGWDKRVNLWNLATGELVKSVFMPDLLSDTGDLRMYQVCVSPRNDLLVTAHLDGTVRVWNAIDLSLKRRFQVPGRFLYGAICFSPDGQWLATGGADGSLVIWDVTTGESMWRAGKHENQVYTVCFADQGRRLVSGADDGMSYCWDLRPPMEQVDAGKPWDKLGQDANRDDAYAATWAFLLLGDTAVTEIESRLQPIRNLIDLNEVGKGLDDQEAQRRRQLTMQLVRKDAKVDFEVRIDRALAILVKLNLPAARALLERLASQHPCKEIREKATAELSNLR